MNNKKVAIVTGAERGIGKGIAIRLAEAGYHVFFTYYFAQDDAEMVKKQIEAYGVTCKYCEADFRKAEEVEAIVGEATRKMGRLDLVVNNAAIMPPRTSQFDLSAEHIDEVLTVNYRAYMLMMLVLSKKL